MEPDKWEEVHRRALAGGRLLVVASNIALAVRSVQLADGGARRVVVRAELTEEQYEEAVRINYAHRERYGLPHDDYRVMSEGEEGRPLPAIGHPAVRPPDCTYFYLGDYV